MTVNFPLYLLLLSTLSFLLASAGVFEVKADHKITVEFQEYVQNASLQDSILSDLTPDFERTLGGTEFIIVSERIEGDWRLMSVVSLDKQQGCSFRVVACVSLILAVQDETRSWQVGLAGTTRFSDLIERAPTNFINEQAKLFLDPLKRQERPLNEELSYKFPWPQGEIRRFSQSWHGYGDDGFDFLTTIAIQPDGTYDADLRVLAPADGVVSGVCGNNSKNFYIDHTDGQKLIYLHLDFLEEGIANGVHVKQGQVLGTLKLGYIPSETECFGGAVANQNPNTAHLHLDVPDKDVTLEGWRITYPDRCFYNGTSTLCEGESITSANEPNYGYYHQSDGTEAREMQPGQEYDIAIKVKNTGNSIWHQDDVYLGVEDNPTTSNNERGQTSALYAPPRTAGFLPWASSSQIKLQESEVVPGNTGTFRATITAHSPGVIRQDLRLMINNQYSAHGVDPWFVITIGAICQSPDPDPNAPGLTFCDVLPLDENQNPTEFYDDIETMWEARVPPEPRVTEGCFSVGEEPKITARWYCPKAPLTRGQMSKFIIRALGWEPGNYYDGYDPPFQDVPQGDTFFRYVWAMKDNGLASGDNGNFYPNMPITRGQMSKFMINALFRSDPNTTIFGDRCAPYNGSTWDEEDYDWPAVQFVDVGTDNSFYNYIRCMRSLGLASGFPDPTDPKNTELNRFEPDWHLNREQAAKFISLLLELVPPSLDELCDLANNNPLTACNYVSNTDSTIYGRNDTYYSVPSGDVDYIIYQVVPDAANASRPLLIRTAETGLNADIRIEVLDSNATTVLAAAEGLGEAGGTTLFWTPPAPGQYYIRLTNTSPYVQEGTGLRLEITNNAHILYLPLVQRGSISVPPPLTPTPTHTPTTISIPPTLTPTATPTPVVSPPTAPSELMASALDTESIRLTWRDNAQNESGLTINDETTDITTVLPDTSHYTVQGLDSDRNYCFRVRAFNDAGVSTWTESACANTAYRFSDDFSSPESGWANGDNAIYSDGEYQLTVDTANARTIVASPAYSHLNYKVSVEARRYDGTPQRHGLVFDYENPDRYCAFSINPELQQWMIECVDGATWTTIANGTATSIVSGTNRLEVTTLDDYVEMRVNTDSLGIFSRVFVNANNGGLYLKAGNEVVRARFDNYVYDEVFP